MQKFTRALFLSALLIGTPFLATGCATASAISDALTKPASSISPTVATAMNAAKKGLAAAHDAHASTADFLTVLAQNGTLHGANAATAKKWLDLSEQALTAADKLVATADADGIMAKVAEANALIAQAQALISK